MDHITELLSKELDKPAKYIENVVTLLDEGNTVPFIARYRKELHGSMDDTALRTLETRLNYLRGLQARREAIIKSIDAQGKLTEDLRTSVDRAATLSELEDLYRPYKPKRRTRATVAREKGLEPLAALLFAQGKNCPRPETAAEDYVNQDLGVVTVEDALQGASDIIAEEISDNADLRKALRRFLQENGTLVSAAATEEDSVYAMYYEFSQRIAKLQGYQILAINRGEKEKYLKVHLELNENVAMQAVRRVAVKYGSPATEFVSSAAQDAYDRLIFPSLEREMRAALTETACEGAIGQFALNLRPLLMQPPVKGKVTMGLDPGYCILLFFYFPP